ncbi:MAG: ImmA/IrrE family metallo-endopeptidase [Elusimicrobia bacterium]|nr:ImmA/IrrE family metallo-endopeptidase [Elusimicrobiota bacterium]
MPLDSKELGQRLKQMREACQITQDAAASALRVSRPTVAQIEAGNRPINTLQLEKLAKLYNRDVGDFFTTSGALRQEATAVFFRMTEELKQKVDRKALEPSLRLLREFTQLEKLLGLDSKYNQPVKYEHPEPSNTWEAIELGQKMAEDERQRLQMGTRPIKDMAELLELQGVRVLDVDMDEEISGVFMGDENIGLSIFINPKHHAFRHAFTLAHEYCHVLVDRARASVVSSAQNEKDLIEVRANAFAAAFLLPKAGVDEFFTSLGKAGSTRTHLTTSGHEQAFTAEQRKSSKALEIQLYDIVHLQHHYGVSWETAVYRLQNLGFINKDEGKKLLDKKEEAQAVGHLVRLELKKKEKIEKDGFETRDFRARFFTLGIDAYRQEIISLDKLQELMKMINIDPDKLKGFLKKADILQKVGV